MTIYSVDKWVSNGELIADVAKLGYLHSGWRTLDVTYGPGTFWTKWRPPLLITNDLSRRRKTDYHYDFTALPWDDGEFTAVVFDPPYKLNGTPDEKVDARYGVDVPTRWQDRMKLIEQGTRECARVSSHMLLVKCMDQVCSGKVRWQSDLVTETARKAGFGKVDRFDFINNGREQPDGRRQVHARHNASQLLVFKKGFRS